MATTKITERSLGDNIYLNVATNNNRNVKFGSSNTDVFIKLDNTDILTSDGTEITFGSPIVAPIVTTPPTTPGSMWYDTEDLTLSVRTGIPQVAVQVGQELHFKVINNTGSTISNGTPVFTSNVDSTTGLIEIGLANAISPFTSLSTLGLTTEDIEDGEIGMVTNFGMVRDFDTSSLSVGSPMYVSTTSGQLTSTKPLSPNNIVLVGTCLVSDATSGKAHVSINQYTRPLANKSYSFTSNGIGAGTYYVGGFYDAPATSVTLSQASVSQSHGSANTAYGAHAFIVAEAAGTTDTGTVGIKVTGSSVTDAGVLTPVDSETLILDITNLTANGYLETTKKWVSSVTFSLFTTSGSPTTYSTTFNYGLCKYEDFGNKDFTVNKVEVVGLAGANDTSFDIHLLKHDSTGWTYHATAFDPGNGIIVDWSTDMGVYDNLTNGENFAWKRSTLAEYVDGSSDEGIIVKIVTGANNSVSAMDVHVVGEIESF
jgi:hypothetical protein